MHRCQAGRCDPGLPWIAVSIAALVAAGQSAPLSMPPDTSGVERAVDTRAKDVPLKIKARAEDPREDPSALSQLLDFDVHPQAYPQSQVDQGGRILPQGQLAGTSVSSPTEFQAACGAVYQEGFAAGVNYQSKASLAAKAAAPARRAGRGDMALPLTGAGSILIIGAVIFLCGTRCRRD